MRERRSYLRQLAVSDMVARSVAGAPLPTDDPEVVAAELAEIEAMEQPAEWLDTFNEFAYRIAQLLHPYGPTADSAVQVVRSWMREWNLDQGLKDLQDYREGQDDGGDRAGNGF
jgi:hypothetical protein